MEASEQVYNVSFDASLAKGEGGVSFNSETGELNVNFGNSSDFSSIAGVVGHEMLHAYQFETGQVSLAPLLVRAFSSYPTSCMKH